MAVQAERLKISITEENRAIRALQEAAYIEGVHGRRVEGTGKETESERTPKKKEVFPYPKTLRCGNAYSYGGFSKAIRGGYNSCVYSGSNGNSANYFQGNADCK